MAKIKYVGEEALGRVADYVNKKLTFASSMPGSPDTDTLILYVGSDTASHKQGGIYHYDGTNWNLINLVKTIELTQAEYNALPAAVQNNGIIYFLTDAVFPGSVKNGFYNENDGKFYEEYTYETEIAGNPNVIYIDLNANVLYIYDTINEEFAKVSGNAISIDMSLSPTSTNPIANKIVYNALKEKVEKTVNDLINYYVKTDVYNKTEVRDLLGALNTLTIEVVNSLPNSNISTTTIYFLESISGKYDEYVYVNDTWVKIGDTNIDLSQYVTSSQMTSILQDYYTYTEVDTLLDYYYTKNEVDTELNKKQNTLTFDSAPTINSTNPVTSSGIKTALNTKQNTLTFDTAPKTGSTNPVTSEGIKTAFDAIAAVDDLINNDMHPVTSNAVYDKINKLINGSYVSNFTIRTDSFSQSNPLVRSYSIGCFFCFSRGNSFICGYSDYNSEVHIISQSSGSGLTASATNRTLTLSSTNGGIAIHGFVIQF